MLGGNYHEHNQHMSIILGWSIYPFGLNYSRKNGGKKVVLRRDVDNWGFNMLTVMMKPTPNGERILSTVISEFIYESPRKRTNWTHDLASLLLAAFERPVPLLIFGAIKIS
jgi:hypothetical protein